MSSSRCRTLPGRTRPGLIEAAIRITGRAVRVPALPGRTRPGLIEALPRARTRPMMRMTLPGRTRPGLIEARDEGKDHYCYASVSSGAYAPRPH